VIAIDEGITQQQPRASQKERGAKHMVGSVRAYPQSTSRAVSDSRCETLSACRALRLIRVQVDH
jgi:hypothetical protein